MKTLTDRFLSEKDKEQVRAAVGRVEQQTAGEIVPMVTSESADYPLANVTGATVFALPIALLLTPVVGGMLWVGDQNMWVLVFIFAVLYALSYFAIDQVPAIKRLFISREEMEEKVESAAMSAFYQQGLYRTRDATGVLIYISVFEKKVWVIADQGINQKVGTDQWNGIVSHIVEGIKQSRQTAAICEAIEMVGNLLKDSFPVRPDDQDELSNLILDES